MPRGDRFGVDLYWLPLGAGGHSVRLNGRLYEALCARREHRSPRELYHSALEVRIGQHRHVIEMAPVWSDASQERGVVAEGSVGSRRLGFLRAFRYEVRCWRDGRIPDVAEAVDSPQRLSEDAGVARRILELARTVPTPVWGRDELRTGDMWNSNSLVAWLLVNSGIDPRLAHLPAGGRAPGWDAGVCVACAREPDRGLSPVPRRDAEVFGAGPAIVAAASQEHRIRAHLTRRLGPDAAGRRPHWPDMTPHRGRARR